MKRRPAQNVAGSPVLIGAVTVLIAIIAVFLSYNANTGLPFVPSYEVTVAVEDAAELVAGNDVRIGGARVGLVTAVRPRRAADGRVTAELDLKLDKEVGPLPRDTEVMVRQRSNLGLKYVELTLGGSPTVVPHGGSLALSQARPAVALDEVLGTFDAETRRAASDVVVELGDGLAGRGGDLNAAVAELRPLFARLAPVARNLADPRTDLQGAIEGLHSAAVALAPVSAELAGLIEGGATTFAAIASVRGPLDRLFAEAPPTEAVGTRALAVTRPVLVDTERLLRVLTPGVRRLAPASSQLALALDAATPVLDRAGPFAGRLERTLAELGRVARQPATVPALERLTEVVGSVGRTLSFANPFQTRCNYLGLWGRNVPSVISEGDDLGTWFRFIAITKPDEMLQRATPAPDLHLNHYPATGQDGECEAGNEVYEPGQRIGPVPGRQPGFTEDTAPPAGTPAPPEVEAP